MSSADRVAHIDGQTHTIIVSNNNTALPAEYKCLNNKTEQSIYECLLGFCFNKYFLRRHKFWLHRQFSLLPNSRNEEMMGDFPLVLLLPVCFTQTSG